MNMNGIYAKSTMLMNGSNKVIEKEAKNNSQDFKKGAVVEGIISKVSDRISIDFSGREISFSKETVQNAKEGEIRKFEIMDVSAKGIVLKEIGYTGAGNSAEKTKGICLTIVESDRRNISENQSLEEEAAAKEETDGEELANHITEEDFFFMEKEFLSIDRYNLERLARVIERMKSQKALFQDSVAQFRETLKVQKEAAEKIGRSGISGNGIEGMIARRLIEADLPVTEENVARIADTLDIAGKLYSMGDDAKAYLLHNDLRPSVENIYKAEHIGFRAAESMTESAWKQLAPAAEQVILSAGMEVNEETLNDARWLLERRIPLTEENLTYMKTLADINGRLSENEKEEFLAFSAEQAAAALKEGKEAKEADLSKESRQNIKEIIRKFYSISDEEILAAGKTTVSDDSENGCEISLRQLKEAKTDIKGNVFFSQAEWDINSITAKRQLEEIRLKLTVESGQKLLNKGIRLETDALSKIVEGLRELEDSYYKNILEETKGSAKAEDISLLKQTSEALTQIKGSPSYVLGTTFLRREIITVSDLAEEGVRLGTSLARKEQAGEAYETVMTQPRRDLGDSIQKAFRNVDDILRDMKLELTDANRRAVRILGYNTMELSHENIQEMKLYDKKVNAMLDSLKPSVTAQMIKKGMNPLDMTVDEVRTQAELLTEEIGISKEEKYSTFLMKLEQQKGITKEERSAYIGIYRLLHQVEQSDGAAIGSVIKAGQKLTLSNLLTAVRTIKGEGVNQEINDEFGALSDLLKKGKSITEQIHTGIANKDYAAVLIKQIADELTPGKLADVMKRAGDMSLEGLSEALSAEETAEEAAYYEQRLKEFTDVLKDSSEAVRFLKNAGVEDNISMIRAFKVLSEGSTEFYRQLNDVLGKEKNQGISERALKIFNQLEDKEALQGECERFFAEAEEAVERAADSSAVDLNEMKLYGNLLNSIRLASSLSEREYYEIPVVTEGKITGMNITVIHNSGVNGRVQVSMDTLNGKVKAEISVKEGELQCFASAESAAGLSSLNEKEDRILQSFSSLGLLVRQLSFGLGKSQTSGFIYRNGSINQEAQNQEAGEDKTDTNLLYRVAKTMVEALAA